LSLFNGWGSKWLLQRTKQARKKARMQESTAGRCRENRLCYIDYDRTTQTGGILSLACLTAFACSAAAAMKASGITPQ
jgi:hypothetical protein